MQRGGVRDGKRRRRHLPEQLGEAREARRVVARHDTQAPRFVDGVVHGRGRCGRIGQAPVTAAGGTLVGLVGRARLLPVESLAHVAADARAWQALQAQPVSAVMWSPVPSTALDTDLRRVAALLLDTGLPGVPVTDDGARLLGFVSRSDLLQAMVADPPLDLWG